MALAVRTLQASHRRRIPKRVDVQWRDEGRIFIEQEYGKHLDWTCRHGHRRSPTKSDQRPYGYFLHVVSEPLSGFAGLSLEQAS